MDEQENKIVSLDKWKSSVAEKSADIGAKEEEDIGAKGESPYTSIGALMAASYMRGHLEGRMHKWMELCWQIFALIISNLVVVLVVWWSLFR